MYSWFTGSSFFTADEYVLYPFPLSPNEASYSTWPFFSLHSLVRNNVIPYFFSFGPFKKRQLHFVCQNQLRSVTTWHNENLGAQWIYARTKTKEYSCKVILLLLGLKWVLLTVLCIQRNCSMYRKPYAGDKTLKTTVAQTHYPWCTTSDKTHPVKNTALYGTEKYFKIYLKIDTSIRGYLRFYS